MNSQHPNPDIASELRHALAAEASVAPLPDGVLGVPSRWVGQRPSISGVLGTSFAVAATVSAALLLALQIAQFAPVRSTGMSPSEAALRAGVPLRQVLETKDGYVALRLDGGPQPMLELLFVPNSDGDSVRRLGFATLNARDLGQDVVGMSTFRVSCAGSSRLAQPDFVFGQVQFAAHPPKAVTLHAPSSGTVNGDLFLFALNPGEAATGDLDVTTISPNPHLNANWTIPAGSFDHADACTGGRVRPVEDLWTVPVPAREF